MAPDDDDADEPELLDIRPVTPVTLKLKGVVLTSRSSTPAAPAPVANSSKKPELSSAVQGRVKAAEARVREQVKEIQKLRSELRSATRAADRTAPWIEQQRVAGNEVVVNRVTELRRKGREAADAKREAAAAKQEAAERTAEAEALRRELAEALSKVTRLERSYDKLQAKFTTATLNNLKWAKDKEIAKRETRRADAEALLANATQLQLQEATAQMQAAVRRAEEAEHVREETIAAAAVGRWAHKRAEARDDLVAELGLDKGHVTLPDRQYTGDTEAGERVWAGRSVRHMASVLDGRPVELISKALKSADPQLPEKLMDQHAFVPLVRGAVRKALGVIQAHWSALHSVHLWDRLGLSRRLMDTLRHLLSFIYIPSTNKYVPIPVWVNPAKADDCEYAPQLAARGKREAQFREMVGQQEVQVSLDGCCQRDFIKTTQKTYTLWSHAMRSDFTEARPAQPVYYLDATSAMLGRGLTHSEVGSADFRDCMQSRRTLGPLGVYGKSDKAIPLRENCDLILNGFNQMVENATLNISGKTVPCRPLASADMQGAKALTGQTSSSHAVWCKCTKGAMQHNYPKEAVSSKEEMMAAIAAAGCEFKTLEEQVRHAHWSWGVYKGGAFTRINCECGYDPSEEEWLADIAAWQGHTDAERKEADAAHNETGKFAPPIGPCPEGEEEEILDNTPPKVHHNQLLFCPPGCKMPIWRQGVDQLHLIFLNMFKHLFMHAIHKNLQPEKKAFVKQYLRAAGFYSYDAEAAAEESPVQRWIGREVKRFLEQGAVHLPFLLRVAAAPAEIISGAQAPPVNDAGEIELDDEDEEDDQPTEEEIQAEEETEPTMMKHATYWDNFSALVRNSQAPWDAADTDAHREKRAVETFNHAAQVANDMLQLNPTMQTWVYHIMCFIVPRQILWLGDPSRRSCDACESFGAMFKKTVKHLTCRRNISRGSTHTRGEKQWRQTFTKSYLQQAFERVAVRETLIHGEANEPYLQREDNCLLKHGTAAQKGEKSGHEDEIISIAGLVMAPTVPTELQESALMA